MVPSRNPEQQSVPGYSVVMIQLAIDGILNVRAISYG